MANVAFTRDEAILALDVLLFSGEEHLNANNPKIEELSLLLNELPIIPKSSRGPIFRNCSGISQQINLFRRSNLKGIKDQNVGAIFYEISDEFENNKNLIHAIAGAIRKNKDFYADFPFGNEVEADGFLEGALLGHLHRTVEVRDGKRIQKSNICDICHLNLSEIYKPINGDLMQVHLLVPVTETDWKKKYKQEDFITVCPTCHAILHRYRPWVTKQNCGEILR